MKLKSLFIGEEGETKIKSLRLKFGDSDSNGDMALIVKNFKRFLRHEKQKKRGTKKR